MPPLTFRYVSVTFDVIPVLPGQLKSCTSSYVPQERSQQKINNRSSNKPHHIISPNNITS